MSLSPSPMSSPIKKVAVFGASGNLGAPITAALLEAGFGVTAITRASSSTPSSLAPSVRVLRTTDDSYSDDDGGQLRALLTGHDAAVCALGPGAVAAQPGIAAAAEAAGVRRLVVDDFGWGPAFRGLPDLAGVAAERRAGFDAAAGLAARNPGFTWTGVSVGLPIDWALAKFPAAMGFDVPAKTATLYDGGARQFTGTTLEGIGRAVAGVLRRPDATANRHVRVRSAQTCQRELLAAFRAATATVTADDREWEVREASAAAVLERGRAKRRDGVPGWTLDLAVAQLYMEESEEEEEEGARRRCFVASREESDNELLGVREESVNEIVAKALLASS
ncbi:hypothetical protein RB597_002610 [Gaeumannomyces tritici]